MHKNNSYVLLTLQLLSFFFILLTGPIIPADPILFFAEAIAVGFMIWGSYVLHRQSKFSPYPEIAKGASLVTNGPFEYIRHPIYSGMLLFALISLLNVVTIPRLFALLILTLVLLHKLHLEEDYLEKHFGEYKVYQKRTKKLIPFFY